MTRDLNRITNSSTLSSLTNLHYFFAGYNRLKDISNLPGLPRLWRVDVRTNLLDLSNDTQLFAIQTLTNRLVTVDFLPQNQRPTITIPSYWPVGANTTNSQLFFTVSDDVTPEGLITLSAVSSNSILIPNTLSNIIFGVTSSNHFLQFRPATNQTGISLITLTATDDTALSTNAVVQVTVITQQNVSVPDPNLNAAIRDLINKPTGPLNNVDLLKFSQLTVDNAGVTNLTGLEYATNLTSLSLNSNLVSSVFPLQPLYKLSFLALDNNTIGDFSPLGGGTNLNRLSLRGNSITNLGFLSGDFQLATVFLSRNRIQDLTPLVTLTNLSDLSLDQNLISNIAVLPNLGALSFVDLTYNLLDTTPGSPAMNIVSNLLATPVIVLYQPQRSAPGIAAPPKWLISQGVPSRLSVSIIDSIPVGDPYTLYRRLFEHHFDFKQQPFVLFGAGHWLDTHRCGHDGSIRHDHSQFERQGCGGPFRQHASTRDCR